MYDSVSADSTDAIEFDAAAAAEDASFRKPSLNAGHSSGPALHAPFEIIKHRYIHTYIIIIIIIISDFLKSGLRPVNKACGHG